MGVPHLWMRMIHHWGATATLASHIVTKGYTYVKAVKDCREDVRKLMIEVNVLCGILQRLVVLLEGSSAQTATTVQKDKHRPDSEADSDQNTSDEEKQDDESIPRECQQPFTIVS